MIFKTEPMNKFLEQFEYLREPAGNGEPGWIREWRDRSLNRFGKLGLPTVKDEEWKYTSLAELGRLNFKTPANAQVTEPEALDTYLDKNEINVVFVNGQLSREHSNFDRLPEGITIVPMREAVAQDVPGIKDHLTRYDIDKEAAFVALNEAFNADGVYMNVAANTVYDGLIHILHVAGAGQKNGAAMPRILIAVGRSGEATVLESHLGFNDKITYFTNALTDIYLDDNATLHYCKAQKESLKAYHIGHTRIWQERNSNYDGFALIAGAKLTRHDLDIVINGEGADAVLNCLYSAYDEQHIDNHTSVDHRVPNATSNQLYKGILNGKARAVFNGKVFVRDVAQQTNSYQLNKNLLLGTDCRVDTKPQLEIFADDVKCTHGATIGQLDEDEMFYLRTRAIPHNAAVRMLVHGFVNDLFRTIKNQSIHRKVDALMRPSFEVLG